MRRTQLLVIVTGLVLFALAAPLWAQQTAFSKLWVVRNKSQKDPRLVSKSGELFLDEAGRKLTIKSEQKSSEINFDDVQKMVFEVTHSMRGYGGRAIAAQLAGGALAGALVAGQQVTNYVCYLEYKTPDGILQHSVLEFPEDRQRDVNNKLQNIFGEKATVAKFEEKEQDVEKKTLKEVQSKQNVKVDKVHHPLPEIKPDKALVVVVRPAANARYAGKGNQAKIHANDRVVLVTKIGTYNFCYLDPGEYLLVSQAENAEAIRINLEPGKDYYFIQNDRMGFWKGRTSFTRHSRELVMFHVSGAYYSDWQQK